MTTSTSPSLLDWILTLLRDASARSAFQADPVGYAAAHGFDQVSGADMRDALCVVVDRAPAHGDSVDHLAPLGHLPSPGHHHGEDGPHYLRHYVNHYELVERHDTYLDNSIHQDIDTGGGDFDQHIDNDPLIASGDGAVAAGGGIQDSAITSGDGNVVGAGNHAVTGDDATTAFGTGAANHADIRHGSFGDGGSLSVGGDASGHSTDDDTRATVSASGHGPTSVNTAGSDGHAHSAADQHESDTSQHSHYADEHRVDSHDAMDSHNHGSYQDSHDYDAHGHF
jgi:hypothetical protein